MPDSTNHHFSSQLCWIKPGNSEGIQKILGLTLLPFIHRPFPIVVLRTRSRKTHGHRRQPQNTFAGLVAPAVESREKESKVTPDGLPCTPTPNSAANTASHTGRVPALATLTQALHAEYMYPGVATPVSNAPLRVPATSDDDTAWLRIYSSCSRGRPGRRYPVPRHWAAETPGVTRQRQRRQ